MAKEQSAQQALREKVMYNHPRSQELRAPPAKRTESGLTAYQAPRRNRSDGKETSCGESGSFKRSSIVTARNTRILRTARSHPRSIISRKLSKL